jgi:hypothetical protein
MELSALARGGARLGMLLAVGAVVLASSAACGPTVTDTSGAGADSANSGGDDGTGTSTNSDTTTGGCSLSTTGTGGDLVQTTECFAQTTDACPDQYEATMYIIPSDPCAVLQSVNCGPVAQDGQCCFVATEEQIGCP